MPPISLLRNLAVFGGLTLMLIGLAGCPQPAGEDEARVERESPATAPFKQMPIESATGEELTARPTREPDEVNAEVVDLAPPAQANNTLRRETPVEPPRKRPSINVPPVLPPATNPQPSGPVIQPRNPEAAGEGIELFAPKNGNTTAQAPIQGAYAAKQPAEKQPLFEGWPQPKAAIVLTGRQHGYIEPCGCTGLANQKGGMARRHTFIQQLIAKGWPVAAFDTGNQVRRFGRQAEIKFQVTASALQTMKYRAVGFGPDDLRLSFGELVAPVLEEGPDGGSMFVSANVNLLDQTPTFRVITVGGKKIGVTTVLNKEAQQQVAAAEIVMTDPAESIAAVMPKLQQANCDLLLLLAQASEEECAALAKKFPQFQIIVSADGAGEPTHDFLPIEGSKAKLVKIGAKGMHTVVIGLFDDPAKPLRYQRVPLDDRFADSAEMLKLLASYQAQLEALGLDGLGLRPVTHPREATFVGSAVCGDCHTTAYEIWKKTPHAEATESLVHPGERTEIPRHFDPECLSCHVTGWNPQGYYPYVSGYASLEASKNLYGNGCENCHGPGSKHVAVELGEVSVTEAEQQSLRESMRLTLEEAKKNQCMTCHDLDNSPDFHEPGAFERYWKKVEHKGLD